MQKILYSKPNCQYCDKVKHYIKNEEQRGVKMGVTFDETANVAEVKKFDGMQFPMLKIVDDEGNEQGIFESEIIIQILEQLK
jgi:glutaredoxin